jgi:centromeric protein E
MLVAAPAPPGHAAQQLQVVPPPTPQAAASAAERNSPASSSQHAASPHASGPQSAKPVMACVRMRPTLPGERGCAWTVSKNGKPQQIQRLVHTRQTQAAAAVRDSPFTGYDHVFGPEHDNRAVYEGFARKMVSAAVEGVNASIFAYGQSGTGKTHTMRGTPTDPGIHYLALRQLFDEMKELVSTRKRVFLLRVSYVEIYMERVRDLLAKGETHQNADAKPAADSAADGEEKAEARRRAARQVAIRENNGVVFLEGLTECIVTSHEEVLQLLDRGEKRRYFGRTNINEHSSRSHTIFTITIESTQSDDAVAEGAQTQLVASASAATRHQQALRSCLNFVDLAGSERMKQSGAEGLTAAQGMSINESLTQLGIVMKQLASKQQFVAYRDSKLTRILQNSLGGNSLTAIICHMSPLEEHTEATMNSLRFAKTAQQVTTEPRVNEVDVASTLILREAEKSRETLNRLSVMGAGAQEPPASPAPPADRPMLLTQNLAELIQNLIAERPAAGKDDDAETGTRRKRTHVRRPSAPAPESMLRRDKLLRAISSGRSADIAGGVLRLFSHDDVDTVSRELTPLAVVHYDRDRLKAELQTCHHMLLLLQREREANLDSQEALRAMFEEVSDENNELVQQRDALEEKYTAALQDMDSMRRANSLIFEGKGLEEVSVEELQALCVKLMLARDLIFSHLVTRRLQGEGVDVREGGAVDITRLLARVEQAEGARATVQSEAAQLAQALAQAQQELRDKEDTLRQVQISIEALQRQQADASRSSCEERQAMQSSLAEATKRVNDLCKENEDMRQELEDLKAKNKALNLHVLQSIRSTPAQGPQQSQQSQAQPQPPLPPFQQPSAAVLAQPQPATPQPRQGLTAASFGAPGIARAGSSTPALDRFRDAASTRAVPSLPDRSESGSLENIFKQAAPEHRPHTAIPTPTKR